MRVSVYLVVLSLLSVTIALVPELAEGSVDQDTFRVFSAITITVAKDGTGDHSTIQAGVDAASNGDTVRVYDGVYKESVNIGTSIKLIGNGTSRSVLDGDGVLDHQHLLNVMASNVNITGFEFREGSPHHEFAGVGIYASNVIVHGNHFYDNTNGVYIAGWPGNVIRNNTFDRNYRGIRSDMGCDRNLIKDNTFTNNTSVGILYIGANNVSIINNDFINNAYHVGLYQSYYYDIGSNLFSNADPGRSGLMVGTSTNNRIHDNTFIYNDIGMSLSSGGDSNDIIHNIFIENLEGIKAYADVNNNEVHQNSFINNSVFGINWSASSSMVNATYNWWGNYTGPYNPTLNPSGTGDNVSVNVLFEPWLLGEFRNHPPELAPIGPQFVDEDSIFDLLLNASDPDGHELDIGIRTNATWLQYDGTTKRLFGYPGNLEVGNYYVEIEIDDGWGGHAEENITLKVNNTPPRILTYRLPNATEDHTYEYHIEFKEEEGAVWSCHSNASWLEFGAEEVSISGTPLNSDVGTCFVHLNFSDNNGGSHDINLSLEVTGVDDPPEILIPLENIQLNEDESYQLDLSRWVVDQDDAILEYSYQGKDMLSVIFDPIGRSAMIIPKPNWSGYDTGRFSVKSGSHHINQTIMIEVLSVNDDPSNVSWEVPSGPFLEGEMFYLNGSANDVDIPYGDVLHFSWYSNISGHLGTGTSLYLDLTGGLHTIVLNVSDLSGAFILKSCVLEVSPLPDDGNETPPANETDDDDITIPDDDDIDDNTTDDNTTDDDAADDDVPDDDSQEEYIDVDGSNLLLYLILLAVVMILILVSVVLIVMRIRGPREEIMSWDDEG
ncbi:MAG: right-handed parallel beta-helix repeat-containing protein [Candidatus Thermoplasmatota archaeon]|nr:right-handed parallel beta-helix repeat-containing protein [Candidatus Thermoplasmatota archaeon]